jgi:ribosomal protein S25
MIVNRRKPPVIVKKQVVSQRIVIAGILAITFAAIIAVADGVLRDLAARGLITHSKQEVDNDQKADPSPLLKSR